MARSKLSALSGTSLLAILTLGLWTGVGTSEALAQTSGQRTTGAQTQDQGGNEIIVTATRREQALQDVPLAVSAYTASDLARLNVASTNDLQRISPSLVISTSTSETGGSTLRIRGVGTTGNNAGLEGAVGVFIDGVYRQRAGLAMQNLFDVDRIEVLRGPQGTLFGKNTSAGALSVVPNLPRMENQFSASLTAGYFGDLDAEGMLNFSVGNQLAIRIAGREQVRNGVMNGAVVSGASVDTNHDFNDRNRGLVRMMALYEPNDMVSWRITADYSYKDEACCASPYSLYSAGNPSRRLVGGFGGVVIPPLSSRVAYVNEVPLERTEEVGLSSHLTIDLTPFISFNTIAAHRRYISHNNADVDFGPADILRQRIPATQQLDSLEGNLTGSGDRLEWLVGAYWSHEQIDSRNSTIYGADTGRYVGALLGGTINPNSPHNFLTCAGLCALYGNTTAYPVGGGSIDNAFVQDGHSWSIFTHDTFHFTQQLSTTLGVRYNDEDKSGGAPGGFVVNSPTCNPAPYFVASLATLCPRPAYNSSLHETATTGVVSLNWEPNPDILTYVSYSHGFKAGGINLDRDATVGPYVSPRGVVTGTQAQINAAALFLPETSDSYELGVKTQWFDRSLTANLAIFKTDYQEFQLNTFNGLGFIVSNAGSVASYGVELETNWAPTRNLFATLGVAYVHARYGNELTLPAALRGQRLTNAPDWTLTGSLNYEVPLAPGLTGFASVNGNYRSEYNTGSNLAPQKVQTPFTLVGAQLGLRSDPGGWDVYLWGENLTNELYNNIVFDAVFQAGSYNSNIGDPETYGITFRRHF